MIVWQFVIVQSNAKKKDAINHLKKEHNFFVFINKKLPTEYSNEIKFKSKCFKWSKKAKRKNRK